MFRKTILIGLVLAGISSTALAGAVSHFKGAIPQMAPAYVPVTIPTAESGLILGVEGLYWTPTNSKLAYGIFDENIEDVSFFFFDDVNGKVLKIDPDYHFGYKVNVGYAFAGYGNDVLLSYTHMNSSDSDLKESSVEEENQIWTRLLHPNDSFDRAEEAKADVRFKYDSIDLLVGQMVDLGDRLDLHLAVGARYTRLDTLLDVDYFHYDEGWIDRYDEVADVKLESKYNGIGPRAVVNGKYMISGGFGFVAEVGGSILVGDAKTKEHQFLKERVEEGGELKDVLTDIKQGETFQAVPEVDAKLGLSYTYGHDYKVFVEGGWKIVDYFGVRNSAQFVDDAREGVYTHHTSDVSFSGPYLSLNLLAG